MSVLDSTPSSSGRTESEPPREIGAVSVDDNNPWLGLASFTEESREYFFGREAEVAELVRRVQRKLLTVLFGKSGLGKTSILRAGLVPRLRALGYFPVYLRIDYGRESPEPAEQIKHAINRAARALSDADSEPGGQWSRADVAAPEESIWEFLHHRGEVLKDRSGATLTPLLIFDQFEELFTLAQNDEFGRARAAHFTEELADLVENRPSKALEAKLESDDSIADRFDFSRQDYRVVIALREDYLAPLEGLKKQMPSLAQNRLRLAPMTGQQALEAVLRPGKHLVSEEVAEAIVRFVAGGSELANAEVEPALLSLICRELNEQRIAEHRNEISQDLLAGSHDTILSAFYERCLADQPPSVRRIIEDDLLTESGYRENLAEESLLRRFQAAGAAPDALAKLVNRRLLRIEERLDVRRVELTHDVLAGVVKGSRDERHEREAREATERALAEQSARATAARRALRRAQAIAAGCTVLAALAIAAAIVAFVNVERARRAEQLAQQTRMISEQARSHAEGLLGFLTDDFVNELVTFGRYQTVAELSQREIDYFNHLPDALKDPQTVRTSALALVDRSDSLGALGDDPQALIPATQAVALLERLRSTDKSEASTIALGRALATRGFVLLGITRISESIADLRRAAELLRPIAEGTSRLSLEARRAYVHALTQLAIVLGASPVRDERLRTVREALRVGTKLRASDRGDVTIDADYAYSEAMLATMMVDLSRDEEALSAGQDAVAVADRVVAQHPQYGWALSAKEEGEYELYRIATGELDTAAAVRYAGEEEQAALALNKIEPGNGYYLYALGSADWDVADSAWSDGRLREAVAAGAQALSAFGRSAVLGEGIAMVYSRLTMAYTAVRQVALGDTAGAAATVAAADRFVTPSVRRKLGLTDTVTAVLDSLGAFPSAYVAYEHEDFHAAQRIARDALAPVLAHPPAGPLPSMLASFSECDFSWLGGQVEYGLENFAAAADAERRALKACNFRGSQSVGARRAAAGISTWLAMALAREGKQEEAARTIAPVVTMDRALDKRNRGDQWLPLELASALYAQALTDDRHRPTLLREAQRRIDHLIPAIANLHGTHAWRARIQAAQHASHGATGG